MPATVTLHAVRGPSCGKHFVFSGRRVCLLGRAEDCYPRLPSDADHGEVSRHHCLLDVDPPFIRVRDYGSLNGTYLNGRPIGHRDPGGAPDRNRFSAADYALEDGDLLQVGCTVFRVEVAVPEESAEDWRGEEFAGAGRALAGV